MSAEWRKTSTKLFVILSLLTSISPRTVLSQGSSSSSQGDGVYLRFGNFNTAPVGRFPYMCSLRFNANRSKHACGGFLVHKSWVLTAAHCVDPSIRGSTGLLPVVYCGIHDIEDDSEDLVFGTIEGILHEDWDGVAINGNDIALLKLDKEAAVTVPRLNAPNSRPDFPNLLDGLGWGDTSNGRETDKLQLAEDLRVVRHETCNSKWEGKLNEERVLCAGIGESDACQGDSGGPLLHADAPDGSVKNGNPRYDLIVGIVSFGDKSCGKSTKPGVYTDVGYYREWILRIIEEGSSPSAGSTQPPQRGSSPSVGITQSPQQDPCATSPKLKDVVAAIKDDDAGTVRAALDCGLNPGSRYNDSASAVSRVSGDTLLHWAARHDAGDSAKVILEFTKDTQVRSLFGETPLHYSAVHGSPSVAKALLASGADINAESDHLFTPLLLAARWNQAEIIEIFLDNGADIDARTVFGETPLFHAAGFGNLEATKVLVSRGANVNAVDNEGETPLHEAAERGHLTVVEVLLDAGASKTMRDNNGAKAVDIVCSNSGARCSSSTRSEIQRLLAT